MKLSKQKLQLLEDPRAAMRDTSASDARRQVCAICRLKNKGGVQVHGKAESGPAIPRTFEGQPPTAAGPSADGAPQSEGRGPEAGISAVQGE